MTIYVRGVVKIELHCSELQRDLFKDSFVDNLQF